MFRFDLLGSQFVAATLLTLSESAQWDFGTSRRRKEWDERAGQEGGRSLGRMHFETGTA
jgi:hypothetical protein